jgi:hypothetical protein
MKYEITANIHAGYEVRDETGLIVEWFPTSSQALAFAHASAHSADAVATEAPPEPARSRPLAYTLEFCMWLQNNAHILVSRI